MRFMLAVIFFGLSFVEANILIESRDEQFANSAQTLLRVRVFNDSKDTLQNVELRYFLSCKERPIILDKHHPQNISAEIVTAGSECPVLKISIPLLFPGMYPDSGGVAFIHSGGALFIAPGEMFVENIRLESGSKVHFVNPGQKTILHLNGSAIWRAQNTNENLVHAAKGFMLVQHGSEAMTVEGMWAGTIFAPNADLILGQSSKKLYGRFLGKNITVHQYATVRHVKFEPENALELVRREK